MRTYRINSCEALAVLAALCALPAFADDNEPPAVQTLEKIEVTGSHIRRIEADGSTPVTIIRREEIERRGYTRIADLLTALPFNGAGQFDDRSTQNRSTLGAAAVSLRGLGSGATLVLLNGRRIVNFGVSLDNDEAFIDVNSLPFAAVDRVEILREGASAIYGADALAGVINIILRKDYRGAEVTASLGQTTHGDGQERYVSATVGAGDLAKDRYNVFISADYLKKERISFSDRPFSANDDQRPRGGVDNRSPFGFPPTIRFPGQAAEPGPGCPPDRIAPAFPGFFCVTAINRYRLLLPDVERAGALLVANRDLAAGVRVFTEISFNRTRSASQLPPSPIVLLLPADAPTNPFGQDVRVRWRPPDLAPRVLQSTIDFTRAVAGLQGNARGWDWEAVAGYNRGENAVALHNLVLQSRTFDAVVAGLLDPFSANNDPAQLAAVTSQSTDRFLTIMSFAQVKASTELVQLAHGPLALATGLERRNENFRTRLDLLTKEGDVAGTSGSGVDDAEGSRHATAAFAELNWPLLKGLEVQFAVRRDDYSDFGGSTSPKLALRWQPIKTLLMRASAGTGFLAPTLFQIHRPHSSEFPLASSDPVRCPVTAIFEDCVVFAPHNFAGNPALKPERSRQYNLGFVWEPISDFSVGLDFWRIDQRDKIAFGGDFILKNEAAFPGAVVRDAPSPEDTALGLPGPILAFNDTYINLAQQRTQGIDLDLKYRFPGMAAGRFTLVSLMSYQDSLKVRVAPNEPLQELIGTDRRPRVRGNASLLWQREPWEASLTANYTGAYKVVTDDPDLGTFSVRSHLTWDAQTAWTADQHHKVALTIVNLSDRPPPFRRDVGEGYDSGVHDPRGRFVAVRYRYAF